jgi:dTDP-N-acetylfucosamine:lipid II N-acetylfucosaminyltransferase
MICHIIFESEYSFRYFQLIEKHFSLKEHYFIIHGKGLNLNQESYQYNNYYITNDFSEYEIMDLFEKSTSIVINGYFSEVITEVFFRNSRYLKKLTWITWGGDIFRLNINNKGVVVRSISINAILQAIRILKRNIASNLGEIRRSFVIQNMKNIIGIEKDFLIVKKIYKTKARYIYGFHPFFIDWDNINEYVEVFNERIQNPPKNKISNTHTYNILLGNSGSSENNHFEALKLIKKSAFSQFQIYCPLSYGDTDNIKDVIDLGENLFGNLFIPITEIMSTDQYTYFLTEIDVAIMNHDRQEGIGTIVTLLVLGVKIYMKTNISSYDFFTKRGIKIFDIEDIKYFNSVNEFIFYDDATRNNNREIAIKEFSECSWVEIWKKIFMQI